MTEKGVKTKLCHDNCLDCSKKILGWTIVGNAFLVVLKLVGGVWANSSGMIADGIQSISCVVTSILVMVTLSFTQRSKDEYFPYGYAKLEILTTLIAFSVLLGIGGYIALSSILAILKHDFVQPDIMVLPIALISIFVTYMIQRHNFCAGEKLDSSAMIANGYHAGADVLSSSAVIGGIILSQMGPHFAVCDKLAALIVGIVIVKDALNHWIASIQNMLDQVPFQGFTQYIERAIYKNSSGYRPAGIKFKKIGRKYWVGINLRCPAVKTVRDTIHQMDLMKKDLMRDFTLINEIDFFIESD